MNVGEVMTSPAITADLDTPFSEIVDLLLVHGISGLPVVDGSERLLGIVTEADLVSNEAYGHQRRRALGLVADALRGRDPAWVRKSAARTAGDLMTARPVSVAPDDDLRSVARLMLEMRLKRLPVVVDDRVVGIVTRRDLLRPFDRSDEAILAEIEGILASPLRVPEDHHAVAAVHQGIVSLEGTARTPADVELLAAVVGRVAGVVDVENRLAAGEPRTNGPAGGGARVGDGRGASRPPAEA